MKRAHRAFTLIELLIVIAIIAILALIAIPNFLEAQTRSKVSRAMADARSIAVALESYFVDNNAYPPHKDLPTDMAVLTTPIAYITSLPWDPFSMKWTGMYGRSYIYQDLIDIYYVRNANWGTPTGMPNWLQLYAIGQGHKYAIDSIGPDLVETMAGNAYAAYDPTNGTISAGDIYRLGP